MADGPMTLAEAKRLVGDTPIAELDDGTLVRLARAECSEVHPMEWGTLFGMISKATKEIDKRSVGESVVPDMKLLREALAEESEKVATRNAEVEAANEESKARVDFLKEMISIEKELKRVRNNEKYLMEQKTNGTKRMQYDKMMAPNSCFAKCKKACRRFEEFHTMRVGSSDVACVRKSSAGIEGWASSA